LSDQNRKEFKEGKSECDVDEGGANIMSRRLRRRGAQFGVNVVKYGK